MTTKKSIAALAVATLTINANADNIPAFPGAEGFARYTTSGGRNATTAARIFHVTRLADDTNTGSLRWAVNKTKNNGGTIVFDVSGYIDLTKDLPIYSNTTIAGQTAPGEGITDRKSTRLNSSHTDSSRMPSSA